MHICFVAKDVREPWSEGTKVMIRNIVTGLNKAGVDVSVVSVPTIFDEKMSVKKLKGTSIMKIRRHNFLIKKLPSPFDPSTYRNVYRAIRLLNLKNKIDVIHLFDVISTPYSFLIKKMFQLPVTSSFYIERHYYASFPERFMRMLDPRLSKRWIDRFFCSSQLLQLVLWRAGIERERTCLVPPPIDVERFKPLNEPTIREKIDIDKDENVILYLGHLNPKRFPQTLLPKFKDLSERLCFKLLIFAPNFSYNRSYEAYLNKMITKIGLEDNIAIEVRDIEEQEKVLIYNMSDVFIYPALEPVAIDPPLTLLEAMACAKIVVASNVQSIPYIIKDGINGFLVEPKDIHKMVDMIEFALQNKDKIGFLNLNARNTISNFCSTNNVAKKMIEIYCDILQTV